MQAGFTKTATAVVNPDTGLQEYLLVAWPDATVYSQMKVIEQQFYIDYGVKPASSGKMSRGTPSWLAKKSRSQERR